MLRRWNRWPALLLCLAVVVLVLFFPGTPWAAHIHHLLKRTTTKAEMTLAKWRGHEPRLVLIAGQLNAPGLQIQALDSRSGWAALSGPDGSFVLPYVIWYPGASYELVISSDELTGTLINVRAPETFPESGVFGVGALDLNQGTQVKIASLPGVNVITEEDYDVKNFDYYKELFDKLTVGKESDDEKISAINVFVAGKLLHEETQWELGSPRRVLEEGSQYCGHLSTVMETLLTAGGYRTRAIHISDGNDPAGTHAVVEVFYDGGWHLYDSTYGVKFQNKDGQIASYKDVRLDTSSISEELFQSVRRRIRHRVVEQIKGMYATGYHHFYEF